MPSLMTPPLPTCNLPFGLRSSLTANDNLVIVDIEAELDSDFAMTGAPEFVQSSLPRQKQPTNTVDFPANIASSSDETHQLATTPTGYGDDEILAPEARLHCRGAVGAAWRLCESSFENKKIPNNDVKQGLAEDPIDPE